MITSMHIENFKCFKDFEIELGPFNVLVGPNDSGKTSLLQAIALVSVIGQHGGGAPLGLASIAGIMLGPSLAWRNDTDLEISITVKNSTCGAKSDSSYAVIQGKQKGDWRGIEKTETSTISCTPLTPRITPGKNWLTKTVGRAKYYLFNPATLREPSPMSDERPEMTLDGKGFPTFLEDLLRRDRHAFFDLENRFYERFPHYKSIEIGKRGRNNVLSFMMKSEEKLDAHDVSDGAILYLAYLAVTHEPDPPKILLIEEPENGVHPSGLKATVEALQHLSKEKDVQIILTTHSPYLLDLVEPEDVRVFAKDEEGAVHAAKLSDHPEVEDLKKHFMTGEIWTEFDEADIVAKQGTAK